MKRTSLYLVIGAAVVLTAALIWTTHSSRKPVYPNRWVRVGTSLRNDADVEKVRDIVVRGAAHGINGLVFSAGLDQLDLKSPEYFERLEKVRQICEENGVEIVPSWWSVGYGGSILAHNKNLAAGLPVKEALYSVSHGEATLVPDPEVDLTNGGFEQSSPEGITGFDLTGRMGEFIAVDTESQKDGKASVRFQNFDKGPRAIRLSQTIHVHPYRCYRLSGWVKVEGMNPSDPFGSANLQLEVLGGQEQRRLQYENPRYSEDGQWHEVAVGFNSWGYDTVDIAPTVSEAKTGKLWLDDLKVEEVGLVNVLRRPGTPLTIKSDKTGKVYEEGRDYAPVADPDLNFRYDHEGPAIKILPGSAIRNGEKLRVSYYHGATVYKSQTPVCMSEPEVYDIWRTQAKLVQKALAPNKYLLNMDEIRVGGSCEACKKRGLTMGEILGDCITRQVQLLREVNPKADVFVWSDMLDPNHNANPKRKDYYLAEGNFVDSWKYVPKDLGIACWYFEKRVPSLAHFSGLGFRTLAGSYYDADNLDNPKGWLEALDKTPGACGIMYTTWLDKYDLLADFGDLVSKR